MKEIVLIEKGNNLSTGRTEGRPSRRVRTAICPMRNQPEAGIVKSRQHSPRAVARRIVNHDQFKVIVRLI